MMVVSQRTHSWIMKTEPQGCASCASQSAIRNKFEFLDENLQTEWLTDQNKHIRAELVNGLSSGRFFWQCSQNKEHMYCARIVDRQKHRQSCPICCPDEKIDVRSHEWLGKLFDVDKNRGYDTRAVPLFHKVAWRCMRVNRHIWTESADELLSYKDCPLCKPRDVIDLANHEALLADFDVEENEGLDPHSIKRSQNASWRCQKHKRNFLAQVNDRLTGKSCPYCANRRLCNENSIAGSDLLSASWDENNNLDPAEIKSTGRLARSVKYSWRCSRCPNTWYETCYSLLNKGLVICPECRKNSRQAANDSFELV